MFQHAESANMSLDMIQLLPTRYQCCAVSQWDCQTWLLSSFLQL